MKNAKFNLAKKVLYGMLKNVLVRKIQIFVKNKDAIEKNLGILKPAHVSVKEKEHATEEDSIGMINIVDVEIEDGDLFFIKYYIYKYNNIS